MMHSLGILQFSLEETCCCLGGKIKNVSNMNTAAKIYCQEQMVTLCKFISLLWAR